MGVCVILTLALLGTELVALDRPATAAAGPEARTARELPPLPSTPAPRPTLDVPEGDFTNPPPIDGDLERQAKDRTLSFDPARSKLVARSATTDTYDNPDGTSTSVLHAAPANYQDATGAWKPIDTTLEATANGRYRTRSAPVELSFSEATGPDHLARLAGNGWSLGFSLAGAVPARRAVVEGHKLRYPGVAPGSTSSRRPSATA
ncbi:MAG: hypothetical protein M3Q48_13760 [Actinomycetota bacterium]|nr:hypothetical protein [Actinomycetota bacterium]